ncbi:MAG: hypothetical protein Q9219_000097 [cf. Caloplaca sp. 3 TL-2023]
MKKAQQPKPATLRGSAVSEVSDESLQSPSASDISCASTVSSGVNEYETGSLRATCNGSAYADGQSTTSSDEAGFAPTATLETMQSGCLPGDVVSVMVTINLGKYFKNPQGIILTLYRECHLDIHPAIPLGPWQNGSKKEYEDYYPKSRTGLGGLSLSSGGSSRVFRQDISQKSTALYVDKTSLTATVKASIHVPEEVFPTISTVPGRMIDFKYFIETIIDLRGKSTIQEHILPRLSMVNSVPNFGSGEPRLDPQVGHTDVRIPPGSGLAFFETSQIRREKGVVTHVSEVVVGTRDSRRTRSKKTVSNQVYNEPKPETTSFHQDVPHNRQEFGCSSYHDSDATHHNYIDHRANSHAIDFAHEYDLPAPEVEDQVDEKTRLRRAEELLLPSMPPHMGHSLSSGAAGQPSAPAEFDESDFIVENNQPGPSAPAYGSSSAASYVDAAILTAQTVDRNDGERSVDHDPLEDKQELERQRLQAQTSFPDGEVDSSAAEASAPVLDEGSLAGYTPQPTRQQHQAESLPRYLA